MKLWLICCVALLVAGCSNDPAQNAALANALGQIGSGMSAVGAQREQSSGYYTQPAASVQQMYHCNQSPDWMVDPGC